MSKRFAELLTIAAQNDPEQQVLSVQPEMPFRWLRNIFAARYVYYFGQMLAHELLSEKPDLENLVEARFQLIWSLTNEAHSPTFFASKAVGLGLLLIGFFIPTQENPDRAERLANLSKLLEEVLSENPNLSVNAIMDEALNAIMRAADLPASTKIRAKELYEGLLLALAEPLTEAELHIFNEVFPDSRLPAIELAPELLDLPIPMMLKVIAERKLHKNQPKLLEDINPDSDA